MFSVEEKLPEFWELSKEIASALRNNKYTDRQTLARKTKPLLAPDLVESMNRIIPGWKNIATLNEGKTAMHTLLVLATCLNLPEYSQFDDETRTEIHWAATLHDLDKKQAKYDTAHPFRSAAIAAQIMPNLGFKLMPEINENDLKAWSDLVISAQRRDGERMLHEHAKLKEIIDGIYRCWGKDSSATRVLKAILLHQSLPTLNDWTNAVLLTDEELAYSLTLKEMDLLGPLMIADSDSWNIFNESRFAYLVELRINNKETRRRIQKMRSSNT